MDNKTYTKDTTLPQSLAQIVCQLNLEGGFQTSVLTSEDGLAIAAYPVDRDNDTTAAIVALLQRVSNDAKVLLDMSDLDEVAICDRNRIRLVCRYIPFKDSRLILAVIVLPDHPYRHLTNRAVKQIEQLLAT
jgi:predicted regulator of Ras-like GTPase activity (Roadblock/LC7/MglB family)